MLHKVLTFDLVSFPPYIKLQTIFLIWVHMVIGLQQATIYQWMLIKGLVDHQDPPHYYR